MFLSQKHDFRAPNVTELEHFGCPKVIQKDPLFRACECLTLIFATHIAIEIIAPRSMEDFLSTLDCFLTVCGCSRMLPIRLRLLPMS